MTAYSIPALLLPAFSGRPVILRAADPSELRGVLEVGSPERVAFAQLTDLNADLTPLEGWAEGLALDLVMTDPVAEHPLLYRHARMLACLPRRVSIPWVQGLARATKLAVSLGFGVRLTGHQPVPEAVAEAQQALDTFLHNPTVDQPVEPFHGMLIALVHERPVRLWSLMERDPAEIRVLDERGMELPDQGPACTSAFRDGLVAAGAECRGCEWLAWCEGYFKWPDTDFACSGIRRLLGDLRAAATELRGGLDTLHEQPEIPSHER
jgi:hypothetical protein